MDKAKLKEALDLINQANRLIKTEWGRTSPSDPLGFGCYKALNAVSAALGQNNEPYDAYYVISRLVESQVQFAQHFKYDMRRVSEMVSIMAKSSG